MVFKHLKHVFKKKKKHFSAHKGRGNKFSNLHLKKLFTLIDLSFISLVNENYQNQQQTKYYKRCSNVY